MDEAPKGLRVLPPAAAICQTPGGGQRHRVKSEQRRVPFGVWIVAILTIVLSTIRILSVYGIGPPGSDTILSDLVEQYRIFGAISVVLGILGIVGAIGLLRLMPAGFVIVLLVAGISLLNELLSTLAGRSDDLRLFIVVVAVVYLNTRPVREAFGRDDPSTRTMTARGAEGE